MVTHQVAEHVREYRAYRYRRRERFWRAVGLIYVLVHYIETAGW